MRLLLFIGAFLVYTSSFAQDWELGAKGGINISYLNTKNVQSDLGSVFGFHLGGYANTSITDQIKIQPEVFFSLQGWDSETIQYGNVMVSYLSIPVMAKYYFVENFNIHAGPQLSLLLNVKDPFHDLFPKTDFGMGIGAEYQINDSFGAAFRYNLGLKNLREDLEQNDVKLRSRVIQFSCTYKLTK